MTIVRSVATLGLFAGLMIAGTPAAAQVCTRLGVDVTCNDGRRGVLSGDSILWPDGTREVFAGGPADCMLTVRKGAGERREKGR